ncbi:MAG: thiamine diphosphokinase, partial [Syntrophales bacterium LBB04]|nr:thiamine diphosphokinase [Syntrophales bacterium LBB04]
KGVVFFYATTHEGITREGDVASKRIVFIIAGGPVGNKAFMSAQVAELAPVHLICADGGARHLDALGLMPDVIIGDMDSLSPDLLRRFEEGGSRAIRHPRDKRETDTQLALEYALQLEPDEIRIFGALGGRIDHALANISLLAEAAKKGVPTKLVDEWCEVFCVDRDCIIEGMPGQTLSLLPLSSQVCGINLEGFAYPLSGGTMQIGAPYGLSNRLQVRRGAISIDSGLLLVVRYHQPDTFSAGD